MTKYFLEKVNFSFYAEHCVKLSSLISRIFSWNQCKEKLQNFSVKKTSKFRALKMAKTAVLDLLDSSKLLTKFRALKMAKTAVLDLLDSSKFHVKSE